MHIKTKIFICCSSFFIVLFFIIQNNFYLYHDDWFFFGLDNQINLRAEKIWDLQGITVKRHLSVPFYLLLLKINKISFSYLFICLINFTNPILLFYILNFFLINEKNHNLKIYSLLLVIATWLIHPFNIGGKFWLTGMQSSLSIFFLFIHYIFLQKKKI